MFKPSLWQPGLLGGSFSKSPAGLSDHALEIFTDENASTPSTRTDANAPEHCLDYCLLRCSSVLCGECWVSPQPVDLRNASDLDPQGFTVHVLPHTDCLTVGLGPRPADVAQAPRLLKQVPFRLELVAEVFETLASLLGNVG